MFAVVTALLAAAAAAQTPHIDYVKPFRILASPSGVAEITIYGTFPMATTGHPDRSQYEHWFVRRVGETDWQECSRTEPPCSMNGWSGGIEKFKLSGPLIARPGLLEMKVHEGLQQMSDDSNIIRIPVLDVFAGPPVIVSLSKTNFPTGGTDADLTFRIAANNFDPSNVRVGFRDDPDVVYPMRVYDGTTIEAKVPAKFRNHEGEIPIFLRTDKGGDSALKYIKLSKAAAPVVMMPAPGIKLAMSPDAMLASRVRRAVTQQLGADVAKTLTVSASNGAVTIKGSLYPESQQKVIAIAKGVEGVKSVAWEK